MLVQNDGEGGYMIPATMPKIQIDFIRNVLSVQEYFDVDDKTSFYMAEAITGENIDEGYNV